MEGNNYLERRKILSGFILVQYVPRIYRIYLSSAAVTHTALWVKGAFNFFLYILASHVSLFIPSTLLFIKAILFFFSELSKMLIGYSYCRQHIFKFVLKHTFPLPASPNISFH